MRLFYQPGKEKNSFEKKNLSIAVNRVPSSWSQRQITKQNRVPGSLECDYTWKEGKDEETEGEGGLGRLS